jgi:hypothetical protein
MAIASRDAMERPPTDDRAFERFASICAFAAGIGGLGYAILFATILRGAGKPASTASALFLLVGGLLSTAVLVAVYRRLRVASPAFAVWGFVLGIVAAVGSAVHGGFDLANIANPPETDLALLPNPVDPRGLLTFGVTAIAIATFGWVILRGSAFPRRLGIVGLVDAALLIVIYVGRLTVLNPKSPVLLVAALLVGFIVNPAWFIWLGIELRRPILR